jgi:hypothetical protein
MKLLLVVRLGAVFLAVLAVVQISVYLSADSRVDDFFCCGDFFRGGG